METQLESTVKATEKYLQCDVDIAGRIVNFYWERGIGETNLPALKRFPGESLHCTE